MKSVRTLLSLLLMLCAFPAVAQNYPDRAITVVVPFAAGGPGDIIGRLLANAMGNDLNQRVLVENVGGAGGTLGTHRVAKAAPDGYTLLLMHVGQATSVTLYRKLPYDPVNDFEPIGLVTDVPMLLVGSPDLPPKDLKELVAFVKAQGDKFLLGNAGTGSASHLCGLLFMHAVGAQATTVQYRGGGPALIDLMAGRINLWCDPATGPTPHVKEGKMKAYAVTTKKRLQTLPNVTTADQGGLPGFEVSTWYGLYAPKGTPQPIISRLTAALQKALKDEALIDRFADLSMEPVSQEQATPAALKKHLTAEVAKWAPIIKAAGVYAD